MTPHIPPRAFSLASTSPIVLLTDNLPGTTLIGPLMTTYPTPFIYALYTFPPNYYIRSFSLSRLGLWSSLKGVICCPCLDTRKQRLSPTFAIISWLSIDSTTKQHEPDLSILPGLVIFSYYY